MVPLLCSSFVTARKKESRVPYYLFKRAWGKERKEEINWLNLTLGAINHVLQYGDRMLHQNMDVAVVMQWVSQPWEAVWCSLSFPWRFNSKSVPLLPCQGERCYFSYIVPPGNFVLSAEGTCISLWVKVCHRHHCTLLCPVVTYQQGGVGFPHIFLEVCRESWEVLWQSLHVMSLLGTVSFESVCNISWIFHIAFISRFER